MQANFMHKVSFDLIHFNIVLPNINMSTGCLLSAKVTMDLKIPSGPSFFNHMLLPQAKVKRLIQFIKYVGLSNLMKVNLFAKKIRKFNL